MITTTESPRRVAGSAGYDAVVIAALVVVSAVYIYTSATVERFGSDTSTYYSLAKTLLAQHRYWFNFEPHTFYPPGFPLLLAALISVVGDSFAVLVRYVELVYFLGAAGLYFFLKRHTNPAIAAAIMSLVVTSYVFYFLATLGIHSDGPYFAVSVFALLWFDIGNSASERAPRRMAQVGVAFLSAYLLLLRSIGITFVGALFVWMLAPDRMIWRDDKEAPSRRIKRWLPSALLPVIVFAGWSYWSATHQPQAVANDYAFSYSRQVLKEDPHRLDSPTVTLKTVPERIFRMAVARGSNATMMVLNIPNLTLRKVAPLMIVVVGLVTIGFVASLVRTGALLDWYVLLYAGILLVYPYDEGMRYLYPIQPFLILYALRGIDALLAVFANRISSLRLGQPAVRLAKVAAFVAIVGMGLHQNSILIRDNLHPDPTTFSNAPTIQSSNWILQNSTPRDVVMDDQDSIVYRLTGRRTFHFPLTTDPNVLRESISDNHVSLVVVPDERKYEYYDPSPAARFDRLKRESPGLFVPVYRFDGGTIYRVRGGA